MNLDQIKQDIEEGKSTRIYYSTRTLWWTHLDSDLKEATKEGREKQIKQIQKKIDQGQLPEPQITLAKSHLQQIKDRTIPTDPEGAPLMQMEDPKEWVEAAERKPEHFGDLGLEAFLGCHHQNCKEFSPSSWEVINKVMAEKRLENKLKSEE